MGTPLFFVYSPDMLKSSSHPAMLHLLDPHLVSLAASGLVKPFSQHSHTQTKGHRTEDRLSSEPDARFAALPFRPCTPFPQALPALPLQPLPGLIHTDSLQHPLRRSRHLLSRHSRARLAPTLTASFLASCFLTITAFHCSKRGRHAVATCQTRVRSKACN